MLTFEQAARLSNDPVFGAIFKSTFAVDKLFNLLPWARVNGKGHTYVREGAQVAADFITSGGAITPSEQVTNRVTANLRTIAASAQLPRDVVLNLSDNWDQAEVQVQSLARGLARELKRAIVAGTYPTVTETSYKGTALHAGITAYAGGPYLKAGLASLYLTYVGLESVTLKFRAPGDVAYGTAVACTTDTTVTLTSADGVQSIVVTTDISELDDDVADDFSVLTVSSSTHEFDGLASVVTNTVTGATAAGDAISFALLRYLVDAVDPDAGQRVMIMPPRTIRALKTLGDALGGNTIEMIALENYGIMGGTLAFEGVPILRNDYLPITEVKGGSGSTTGSVYCLSLAPASGSTSAAPFQAAGICGLYGAGAGRDTDEGPTMGVSVVVDETPRDGDGKLLDAVEVAVRGDFALANYGPKCSARLYGITN